MDQQVMIIYKTLLMYNFSFDNRFKGQNIEFFFRSEFYTFSTFVVFSQNIPYVQNSQKMEDYFFSFS